MNFQEMLNILRNKNPNFYCTRKIYKLANIYVHGYLSTVHAIEPTSHIHMSIIGFKVLDI